MRKIQVVHISTIPEQERCTKSKKNIKVLEDFGVNIKYITNPIYSGNVPYEHYRLQDNLAIIKPSHYGCYLAHMQAIMEMNSDYDYTIVMEEDAYIACSPEEFMDAVNKGIDACEKEDVYFINLGSDNVYERLRFDDYFDKSWHQTLAHCYLIPNRKRDWYVKKIQENPWDSADLWFNHIFCHDQQIRLASKKQYSGQLDGISAIDNVYRNWKHKNNNMIYDKVEIKEKESIEDFTRVNNDIDMYEKFFPVEQGDVVVDIGAHVGFFSKRFAEKASKCYALEPDLLFYNRLVKDLPDNVIPFNKGIGGKDGKAFIKSDGHFNAVNNNQEGESIDIITFQSFLKENNIEKIDFLKIDCEGGEYDVLTKENIDWIKNNVRKVAGEFHIHSDEHRALLPYTVLLLEKAGITPYFMAVNGVVISKQEVLGKLDFYKEVLFYFRIDEPIVLEIPPPSLNYHFVDGCFLELNNWEDKQYNIKFIDKGSNKVLHETVIGNNNWTRCFYKYFIDWRIVISENDVNGAGKVLKTIDLDLNEARVFISLESKALGDTLAWIPYAEVFKKKHNCQIMLSTFHNSLFKDQYPDIEFVEPGAGVPDIRAQYSIGWFYNEAKTIDYFRNPSDFRKYPLQKTATEILGLMYTPLKPRLNLPECDKKNVVTLGFHGTAQAKYWNNPTGWQDTVDYINSINYTPLMLSNEGSGYMGNVYPDGIVELPKSSLKTVIRELCESKLFIGIGSGLSWLAWACNVPVILISGFSEPYTEMSLNDENYIRIGAPDGVSSGCFNKYKFDAGNWNWYEPKLLVGTERQFECSKSITSDRVIDGINKLLKLKN